MLEVDAFNEPSAFARKEISPRHHRARREPWFPGEEVFMESISSFITESIKSKMKINNMDFVI